MLIRDLKVPVDSLPDYLIINYEHAQEYENDARMNFHLIKAFEPEKSFMELSYVPLSSHVNTKISFYGKNQVTVFLKPSMVNH